MYDACTDPLDEKDIVYRLKKRAEIRRNISSVQEGKPDRIADLLDEAANEIFNLRLSLFVLKDKELKNSY